MSSHSAFNDLHDASDFWTIQARVLRKWNVFQKKAPSELCCVSLLLVDAEGTKIQASILTKSIHPSFWQNIHEGRAYEIENFAVSPNIYNYRATTHRYRLTLSSYTTMHEKDLPLPNHTYSLKSIPELLSTPMDDGIDYLFDILGFLKCIGQLEEQQSDGYSKQKLRMILSDPEENEIECLLFDNCASDTYMAHLENNETPVVLLINLAKLGWTEDGKRQVSSSYCATRVYFNPQLKEVSEFIERAREISSTLLTTPTQSVPTQSSHFSGHGSLHNQSKLKICNIPDQPAGTSFVLHCEIAKFESKFGWWYDGCSKCNSKAKPKDACNPNSPLSCPTCKPLENPAQRHPLETKMKLHYIVKDDTGSASIIFWDKLAVQLMNKTAMQLKLTLPEEKRAIGFPRLLDQPVGKKLLLKLKLNDYNKKFPSSSISANDFTFCDDLISEFDAESDEEIDLASNTCKEATPSHIIQPLQASLQQDTTPAASEVDCNIIESVSQQPLKGKRRSYIKRGGTKDDHTKDPVQAAKTSCDSRLIKIIKQEK